MGPLVYIVYRTKTGAPCGIGITPHHTSVVLFPVCYYRAALCRQFIGLFRCIFKNMNSYRFVISKGSYLFVSALNTVDARSMYVYLRDAFEWKETLHTHCYYELLCLYTKTTCQF